MGGERPERGWPSWLVGSGSGGGEEGSEERRGIKREIEELKEGCQRYLLKRVGDWIMP